MPQLILTQLTGPRPRTVTLADSAIPEKELPERYELSFSKTYYPGAAEPTVQILNVESRSIRFEGLLTDREAGRLGHADSLRDQLRALQLEARPVRLQYRTLDLRGFISRLDFAERDEFECRYEIEFDPISQPPVAADRYEAPTLLLHTDELRGLLADLAALWAELPASIREGNLDLAPADLAAIFADVPAYREMQILDVEALPTPVRVLFERDPWLEARLQYEELHRTARVLLELAGNEELLNLDDRAQVVARGAMIAANRARYALADFLDPDISILERINQTRRIGDVVAVLDSIRLAL